MSRFNLGNKVWGLVEKAPSLLRPQNIDKASGVAVPGLAWFTNHAPPLFPDFAALFASGIPILIAVANHWRGKRDKDTAMRWALWVFLAAVGFVIAYGVMLEGCSVVVPRKNVRRIPIGFGKFHWSLTPHAADWLQRQEDPQTTFTMMMALGGFEQDGVYRIWQQWTVFLAGILTIVAFVGAASLWTWGWCLVDGDRQEKSGVNAAYRAKTAKKDAKK